MRKSLLALGVLVGCHAPARKAAPAARPVGNAVETNGPIRDDVEAMARWELLGLTGADWETRLDAAELDMDDAAAMAKALLRAGGFTCNDVETYDECGTEWSEMKPVSPEATFDDPCLRRLLAMWSLDQLDEESAPQIVEVLDQLVAMPLPERELQVAAFDMAGDDDQLRLHLMAHASAELAEQQGAELKSDEGRRRAVHDLHIDSALVSLDWATAENRAVLLGAINDEEIDTGVRREMVLAMGAIEGKDVDAALTQLADRADDCSTAMAAAEALAARGDKSRLPVRPKSHDVGEHMRAMCMLQYATGDDPDRFAAWIPKGGITTDEEHYDYDYDPDNPPDDDLDDSDGETVEHVGSMVKTWRALDADDVDLEELLYMEPYECDATGLTCTFGSGYATMTFVTVGASLVIDHIATSTGDEEYGGCGC